MSAAKKLYDPYSELVQEAVPAAKIKRKKKRSGLPATVKICILAAICVALSLLYLQQQVVFYNLNVELAHLKEKANSLEQRNDYLMLDLESERSLPKIEHLARTELGMIEPQYTVNLVLEQVEGALKAENSRWSDQRAPFDSQAVLASLAAWFNRAFPLGGVEAGTLQR